MKQDFLKTLYSQENDLLDKLSVIQNAINVYGGNNKKSEIVEDSASEITKNVESIKQNLDGPIPPRRANNSKELNGYINEILKDVNKPVNARYIYENMKSLGFDYAYSYFPVILSTNAKKGLIKRHSIGYYTTIDNKIEKTDSKLEPIKQTIKTLKDIYSYIELRNEVSRKELMKHFVDSKFMSENKLNTRVEKLINMEKIIRLERGVYRLK